MTFYQMCSNSFICFFFFVFMVLWKGILDKFDLNKSPEEILSTEIADANLLAWVPLPEPGGPMRITFTHFLLFDKAFVITH